MEQNLDLQEFRKPQFQIGATVRHSVAGFDGPIGIITSRQYIEDVPNEYGYWQYFVRWFDADGLKADLIITDEIELLEEG